MSNAQSQVIIAENLCKTFRDFWGRPKVRAVDNVSFVVNSGEVFGLLGPNGSGKSTTLKMILGLLHPTHGRLEVLGRWPRDVQNKSRIGYLPEESYLYPYLTCEETLFFYGRLFDLPPDLLRDRIEQLLGMIGLRHARGRLVGEFSKGMMRRIGLAQALINDPDLVILDEPTSGLDPIACRQVKDLILALARRGKTILLSSHLLADVEDVCDRILILYDGRARAQGAVRDLLEVKTQTRITLQEIPPDKLREVLALLRAALGSEPALEHPRRNLERFFLDVVAEAQRASAASTGAQPTQTVARYLGGDGSNKDPARDQTTP